LAPSSSRIYKVWFICKKELSVYAIILEKTPHKLTKNESSPNGLPGRGLRVARGAPPQADAAAAAPDLFTAFREQLGLKLDSTRAPAEVFVIDAVEKSSQN